MTCSPGSSASSTSDACPCRPDVRRNAGEIAKMRRAGKVVAEMHEVTRQILGLADRTSASETSLVLTATIQ